MPGGAIDKQFFRSPNGSRKINLNNIHLDSPLKSIINHLDDLRIASHKVDEAERIISEQEWKVKRSNVDNDISFMTYVGMVATGIVMTTFCYCCCCKFCLKNFPNLSEWWKDNNPCTTVVFKPKIVNSINTSRESLKFPTSRASIKQRSTQSDAVEVTELMSLNSNV
jgi:hypothetical protein